jgi:hypothetical protein
MTLTGATINNLRSSNIFVSDTISTNNIFVQNGRFNDRLVTNGLIGSSAGFTGLSTFTGGITSNTLVVGGITTTGLTSLGLSTFSGGLTANNIIVGGMTTTTLNIPSTTASQLLQTDANRNIQSAGFDSSDVLRLSTNQTVSGSKTFTPQQIFNGGITTSNIFTTGITALGLSTLRGGITTTSLVVGNINTSNISVSLPTNQIQSSILHLGFGRSNNGTVPTPTPAPMVGFTGGQIAFSWGGSGGGFNHYIATRHNAIASNPENAIDFILNDSTTSTGSTMGATTTGAGAYRSLSITPIGLYFYNNVASYLPSNLNHYEELNTTLTFSGLWATNQTINIRLTRTGRTVVFSLNDCFTTGNNNAIATSTDTIPARFRPYIDQWYRMIIYGAGFAYGGLLSVLTTGTVQIGSGDNQTNWPTAAGNTGWESMSMCWHT